AAETYPLSQIKADERIVTATPYYKYSAAGSLGTYQPEKYMLDNIESADDAFATVLAKAGTVNRDKVELRIINDTRTGKNAFKGGSLGNGIIDTEAQAEGFFDYAPVAAKTDTDLDGMPDEWERANGLNPEVADNNLVNSEGYTALEAYINSLMGEAYSADFRQSGITVIPSDEAGISYDNATATLNVSDIALGSQLTVYSTDGRVCSVSYIDSTATSLAHLPSGIYLLHITSPSLTPAVLKIAR
ncbi:MAG: T9SS type A sorting domain-containing protein, partial [Duncaniella sp.]|nr:T9SS type A sorting domain-containing protein [Duncaniella sp.]